MSDRAKSAPLPIEYQIARILEFLAADPGRLVRFFNVTGLSAETIRDAADAPGFAASVLDHVLEDEPLLQQFATEAVMRPEELVRARSGLDGRGEGAPKPERAAAVPIGPSAMARRYGAG